MTSIVEVVVAVILTAFVLLLICGLAFLRRFKRAPKETDTRGYSRVESDGRTSEETEVEKEEVRVGKPHAVTWAEPLTQHDEVLVQSKLRSLSCVPPHITTTVREERDAVLHRADKERDAVLQRADKAETRKHKRRRAKSMCFFHVCQVQFSIFYNFYLSRLFLKLMCAVNIPSTFGVTYGSYIKAELVPSESAEKSVTSIQFHTNNPVYNETIVFPNLSYDDLLNSSLRLKLFTVDRFSRSSLLGRLLMPFVEFEINPEKPTIIWRVISSNDDGQDPKAVSSKENLDKGELYISLRYQFLSDKVTVVVMKATNLPQANKIFGNDPYVIVKLLLNLKPVKTKKTTHKRHTSSPCWNEPLVFEIDEKTSIFEYSLSFKVKNRNTLSEDPTLGQLEIGHHANALGKQHWKDMIVKKDQDRAVCHKLK